MPIKCDIVQYRKRDSGAVSVGNNWEGLSVEEASRLLGIQATTLRKMLAASEDNTVSIDCGGLTSIVSAG